MLILRRISLAIKQLVRFVRFKSICQFDTSLKENDYRILPKLKPGEALERVKGAVRS